MDYQDFELRYRTDPITFHLGMELFDDRGRDALSVSTDQALCAAVTKKLSELLSADKIQAVVKAARDFAGLTAVERLSYAARCGVKLEDNPADKPDICPLCGEVVCFDSCPPGGRFIKWHCNACGASGKAGYRSVFDCHYEVKDGNGKPMENWKQSM